MSNSVLTWSQFNQKYSWLQLHCEAYDTWHNELQNPNTKLFSVWMSNVILKLCKVKCFWVCSICSLKTQQVTDSCNGRAEVANTPVSQVALAPVEPGAAACHWQHQPPIVVWSQQAWASKLRLQTLAFTTPWTHAFWTHLYVLGIGHGYTPDIYQHLYRQRYDGIRFLIKQSIVV